MKKIKLFSHTDLDGFGCNLILKSLYFNNVKCTNCNYDTIDDEVYSFLANNKYTEYDKIIITDISLKRATADYIDALVKEKGLNIILLDHHVTAEWMNMYEWCNVMPEVDNVKLSGSRLLFDYICDEYTEESIKHKIFDVVENIQSYDTWAWKKDNKTMPKKLNNLFTVMGSSRFINAVLNKLSDYDDNLTCSLLNEYALLLDLEQEHINGYIGSKNKELMTTSLQGYTVGVVFAEQHISELGNKLCELHPECDLIAIIGSNTVSYRSIKTDVDCSEIASLFGGGGHKPASGSPITLNQKAYYINKLFMR